MEDRRTAHRFALELPVQLSVPSAGEAEAVARTRDVSYRGLYFVFDRTLSPGSRIQLILTLPKEVTMAADVRVQCDARVVRVEELPQVSRPDQGKAGIAAVIERYEFLRPPA